MPQPQLRIFDESTSEHSQANVNVCPTASETVTVTAGEIFPALADALANGKTWIKDFENDEVTVPYDLYEVILAYQHYQRLTA